MDNIILDRIWIQNSPVIVDSLQGTMFTGEDEAHTFRIRGIDAAQASVAITGTITGSFLASNNVTVPLSGSLSNGMAMVTLTDDCYAIPGRFILSIYATNNGATVCIYCGVGKVLRTQTSLIAYPSADLPDIVDLMGDLQDILDGWPSDYTQIQSDIASLKSRVSDLEAGKFKTDSLTWNTSPGSWGVVVTKQNMKDLLDMLPPEPEPAIDDPATPGNDDPGNEPPIPEPDDPWIEEPAT